MLQDLAFGKMENQFRTLAPANGDVVVCFEDNRVLLKRNGDDTLELPTYEQVMDWAEQEHWQHWNESAVQYIFRLQDVNYFIWMGQSGNSGDARFDYESVKMLRQVISKDVCFGIMTAWHLFVWYRDNRFCGRCGHMTVHDGKERMMRCPDCGNMIFPKIAPAVIVAVTDGNRLLLTKYAGRAYAKYALVAGFTEIGESVEDTVRREVLEEVGLHVKNVTFYKSQPWSFTDTLLMGFYCEVDGSREITLDENELAVAEWFEREEIPVTEKSISLTNEMILNFKDGNWKY